MRDVKMVDVPELQDPRMTLREYAEIIAKLIAEHGPETVMEGDAGYNNISFELVKET